MNVADLILDIRKTYLTENRREDWEKYNILYNTLWFDYFVGGPDIEHCKKAIEIYKKIPYYKQWKEVRYNGFRLEAPKSGIISADIMTGWWMAFKLFLRLEENLSSVKIRKEYIKSLLQMMSDDKVELKDSKVAEWMSKNFKRDKNACEKCLNFLDIVYTAGNIIPIATSYSPLNTLDGWDTKLLKVLDKDNKKQQISKWRKYLEEEFTLWKNFIEINYLQCYFKDSEYRHVDLFWDRTETFQYIKATDGEWESYFEKVIIKIKERNKKMS